MVDYRITSVDPSALSFTGGEWDGDDARTTMPNPSAEQTDRSVLDESFVFVPTGDDGDSRDEKANWKCPFREEPGGPASERGLLACLQAVNGARGGIDGIDTETLQDGYDWIVDALTAAGQYEDRADAPDFEASASEQIMAEYAEGDTVTWGKSDDGPPHPNQAYGVIRDMATDGENNFGDMIDGPFAPEGTEDNPAYLIEVLDETDDGWVPSGTMVGHRGDTLESFDAEVVEAATDYGDSGGDDGGFTPTMETDDGVPLFDSREAAEQAAEMSGCSGSHEMDMDGQTMYAPCEDHGTATDTIDAASTCVSCSDASLTRRAEGSLAVDQTRVEAASDALRGIVWAAGDHDLSLGGNPTGVRVPAETVDQTFDWLTEDIQDDGVGIGFDHPDRDSVAAQTGLVEIGEADAVGLSETGDEIVLTDSTLTNDQAVAAAADGQFDQLDFSVVADVAVREDDNGETVTENGRVVLDAVRITRIDVVNDGAVASASITTDQSDLPSLQQTVAAAVADPSARSDAVDALRASAAALQTNMDNNSTGISTDPTDLSAARSELSAAADMIEQLEGEKATLKDAFTSVVAAHDADVDPSDVDDAPDAAAQAVIDAATVELRKEIAQVEADLAKYDTDDVPKRTEQLKGSDAEELRRRRDRVKAEAYDREQRRQSKGAAAARQDTVGRSSATGGDTDADLKAEDMAKKALDGRDRLTVETTDSLSASQLLRDSYGIDASAYQDVDELRTAVTAARTGDNE